MLSSLFGGPAVEPANHAAAVNFATRWVAIAQQSRATKE